MDPQQKTHWERLRVMGKWRYVLVYGLQFAAVAAIVSLVFVFVFDRVYSASAIHLLLRWLVVGFLWAWFVWTYNEARYRKR